MNKTKTLMMVGSAILVILALIGLQFGLGDNNVEDEKSDGIKIKEEYESLNDKKSSSGYTYPKVSLKETNPFKYASEEEIIKTLKNGTGLIYLGFKECPWCRNAINVLQYVSINEILYLDMTNVRDKFEVVDGKVVKIEEGSKGYKEMLSLLDSILDDYEIKDQDGNVIKTGEKRIYVPLVIGVKDGKIVGYHADTVDLDDGQTPYDLLTKKEQNDLKLIYDEINAKVSDDSCVLDADHGC